MMLNFNMPTINQFPPSTKPSKGERGVEEDRSMTTKSVVVLYSNHFGTLLPGYT